MYEIFGARARRQTCGLLFSRPAGGKSHLGCPGRMQAEQDGGNARLIRMYSSDSSVSHPHRNSLP
jgi:hypothetical protein